MQLNFILSPQFQKSEYLRILSDIEKEFSDKLPGIRKIVIEIKLHSQAVYKPAAIISGLVGEQLYKIKLNFARFYKGDILPDPAEFCERVKSAVNRVMILAGQSLK